MLQDFYSRTIDPKFLDLKAHPITRQQAVDTLSESDDVAIASGQAAYGEGFDNQMKPWGNSSHDLFPIDDFESLGDLDFGSAQVHSAPARAWDMGGLDSDSSSRYEVSSPVRENEPWDRLQTSAFSAPGPNHRCSRVYQFEVLSPGPSSLLDPGDSRANVVGSQYDQQDAPMQKMILHDSYHHQATRSNSFLEQFPQTRHQHIGTPQYGRFNQGYNAEEGTESEESAISDFALPPQDDIPMAASLTSSTTAPRAIPRGRKAGGRATRGSNHGVDYPTCSPDYSMLQGRTDKSSQESQPVDPGLQASAIDSSWGQRQSLTSEPEWIYDVPTASPGASGRGSLTADRDWPSYSPYKSIPRSRIYQEVQNSIPCDYSGAIRIPGSSEHYQADLTSSFPPTAGHLPDYLPTIQPPRRHRSTTISTSQPTITLPNHLSLPMRRKISKTKDHRRSRSGSLKAIQEDNSSVLGSSPTGSTRGRRNGQLAPATALAAAQKRSERTVCIRCRMMKQTCRVGNLPCEGCQKNSNARSWGQPCTKADFRDTVDVGTCNAVFQRSASVLPLGQNERINISFDGSFDVSQILRCLQSYQGRYNIHVQQFSGFSYILDLVKLTRVLSIVHRGRKMDTYELDDFGENKMSKASDWLDCLNCLNDSDRDPSASIVGQSIKLNNMPSRNSYCFLPLDSAGPPQPLNVINENDKKDILLAVHLCRIVLRALEVSAFRSLQKDINELPKNKQSNADIELLVQHLREILFSLRWRISWWAIIGMSSSIPYRDCYTERVTGLTQTLYYWYFVAQKRLSSFRSPSPNGQWSVYADATHAVLDDFPHDESVEGFGAWLAHGKELVSSAQVKLPQTHPMPCY